MAPPCRRPNARFRDGPVAEPDTSAVTSVLEFRFNPTSAVPDLAEATFHVLSRRSRRKRESGARTVDTPRLKKSRLSSQCDGWHQFSRAPPLPHPFLHLFIPKGFKSNEIVRADSKGFPGAFFVRANSKGVTSFRERQSIAPPESREALSAAALSLVCSFHVARSSHFSNASANKRNSRGCTAAQFAMKKWHS
jgi:hypothetical protein